MKVEQHEIFILPKEDIKGIYTHAMSGRYAVESGNCMIVDGKSQEEYEEIIAFKFSTDGSSYAYIGRKDNHDYFILNGQVIDRYEDFKFNTLTNGPNQNFAFSVKIKDKVWIIHNTKKYGPLECHPGDNYQQTSPLAFNDTGDKIAFAGKRNEKYALEINEKRFPQEFKFVRSIVFGPDESIAYRALMESGWSIVFNDQIWGPYKKCNSPAISYNGNDCGYLAEDKNGIYAFINGQPVQGPFSRMGLYFYFTLNGFAYEAEVKIEDENRAFVMMNGTKGTYFDSTRGLVISKNGESYAYIAQGNIEEGEFLVLDNKPYGPYKNLNHPPAISPDGKRAAGLVLDDRDFVIVNGEKGPYFEGMYGDMHWTEDGKKLMYIVKRDNNLILIKHNF